MGYGAVDGTLYDGPLSKPAHYVGLKDRRPPVIKMPNAEICSRFMDVEGLLDAAEGYDHVEWRGRTVSRSQHCGYDGGWRASG